MSCHLHHLGVERWVLLAKGLYVELGMLTVPACLRPLVAKDRSDRIALDRLGQGVHAMLDKRAHNASSELGTERDPLSSFVLKAVHLFVNNVGTRSYATRKEIGGLEHGDRDLLVPIQLGDIVPPLSDVPPHWPTMLGAELLVVGVEGAYLWALGVRRALLWSACANGLSVGAGLLRIAIFGW